MPSLAVLAHLSAALAALGLTGLTLALPKGGRRHRLLGRAAAAALLATAAISFWVPRFGAFSGLHVLSLVTLTTIPLAVWAIRRGNRRLHRNAMLGNAFGLFAAAIAAATIPGRLLSRVLFDAVPHALGPVPGTLWWGLLLLAVSVALGLRLRPGAARLRGPTAAAPEGSAPPRR